MMYMPSIGLEIHAELKTESKIFCSCKNSFGATPNTHVCPVCMGLPGVLPTLNKKVVELAAKAGLMLNCNIARKSTHDRKNYFYPDLPKSYQISQNVLPLCFGGYIEENGKKIKIKRIHIEEDAGKLIHNENGTTSVDFNRSGVPLIEIVTEPDIKTSDEALAFLETLKAILEYAEISDCKMQEGSLRCDVNVSLAQKGSKNLGNRCEVKNLNSFSAIKSAIDYEIKRQTDIYNSEKEVAQETRRWDDSKKVTVAMRTKEDAFDYMYFPEPDLLPICITDDDINKIRKTLPETPNMRKKRLLKDYSLTQYEVDIITSSRYLADFFEECVSYGVDAKTVSNWLMGDVLKTLNEQSITPDKIPFNPHHLAKMILFIKDGTISNSAGKKVLSEMFKSTDEPEKIISDLGLLQVSDKVKITAIVNEVISENPKSVDDYKSGNTRAFGFLVGQAMKKSGGKANPKILNEILIENLKK